MNIRFTQSYRDDIMGHVIVDHEDGRDLEIHECWPKDAVKLMAKLEKEYAKEAKAEAKDEK